MINDQLINYIKSQTLSGIAVDDIKKALLSVGWRYEDIQEAFSHMNIKEDTNHILQEKEKDEENKGKEIDINTMSAIDINKLNGDIIVNDNNKNIKNKKGSRITLILMLLLLLLMLALSYFIYQKSIINNSADSNTQIQNI